VSYAVQSLTVRTRIPAEFRSPTGRAVRRPRLAAPVASDPHRGRAEPSRTGSRTSRLLPVDRRGSWRRAG